VRPPGAAAILPSSACSTRPKRGPQPPRWKTWRGKLRTRRCGFKLLPCPGGRRGRSNGGRGAGRPQGSHPAARRGLRRPALRGEKAGAGSRGGIRRPHKRAEDSAEQALAGLVTETLSSRITPHGCYVYLLWGDDETKPIYVGKSTNFLARLGAHMSDPARKHRIRSITLIRCKDGRQMDKTELRLIRRYRPELNTAGIPLNR
jgi:GIY-YIG catalytic domain